MAYYPNNPNGRASASASAPVVLANDIISSFSVAEATTGGASVFRLMSTTSSIPVPVKSSAAGKVTGWYIYNNATSYRVLRFFNSALPPSTAANPYLTIPIPAGSAANCPFPAGIDFSLGIHVAVTITLDDASTTAPTNANDLIINIFYK